MFSKELAMPYHNLEWFEYMNTESRLQEGISLSRKIGGGSKRLYGVLDLEPDILKIMPTISELKLAQKQLEKRLKKEGRNFSPSSVRSIYARGDGNDTPLGLKETIEFLLKRFKQMGNN